MNKKKHIQDNENFGILPREKLIRLLSISKVISSTLELDQVLDKIMREANEILSAEASSILLLDSSTKKLYFRTTTGARSKELKKFTLDMGEGIAGWVAENAQPVLVKDADKDNRFKKQISDMIAFPVKSLICVPLSSENKVIGVMELLNNKERGYFNQKDLMLASLLAGFAGIAIDNAWKHKETCEENTILRNELEGKHQMIGKSKTIKKLFDLISKVSKTSSTVHISGPSGTGKELVARTIHHRSLRSGKPFVCVACSILTGTLLESELFGHEKGAFTGADKVKIGKFEAACGGTVFLDEIGTLSHETQIKLLRVLEERQIERVGGNDLIDIDIRVISATNEDIDELVEKGKFREDLLYRLKVIQIDVPPLKERIEDIPVLAGHFLSQFAIDVGRDISKIDASAMRVLMDYSWPGNVRELRNAIERAVVLGEGEVVLAEHLPEYLAGVPVRKNEESSKALDSAQKEHVLEILNTAGWNKSRAAKQLNISRNRLDRMIKQFDISRPEGF